jgi:hypothetical protein
MPSRDGTRRAELGVSPRDSTTGREYCITCVATSSGVPFWVTPPMPV